MTESRGWLSRLAVELSGDGPDAISIDAATVAALLRIARDVAHGSERVNAPLSTYLAGRYVADQVADGVDEAAAIAAVEQAVRRLLADDSSA